MGRKTYDSVPKHLRPLGKRISVVVTRDTTGAVREGVLKELEARKAKMAETARAKAETETAASSEEPITDALVTTSLDAALSELDAVYGSSGRLGKIYVIGGAEIYGAALRMKVVEPRRPVRIVMTNVVRRAGDDGVVKDFECDTFFPVAGLGVENGWRTASAAEVSEWVGETVTGEWIQDGEVEVQMVGYERMD
jgi:dihydrofolate reductase